ncbi:glycoside hydrolase family 36 protein [Zobellia uliginosa]|uniref:glycoside hydrolase family 36 protein n=1 Tax=Zobellia uliginosa TaxID=143224 RepID=UPI001C0680AF|nr:glycoside hydrolase family 36 protein [Zobellia uliginosa]MBU2945734.1 alpha-galactosidase [Zobellia uliginosa]
MSQVTAIYNNNVVTLDNGIIHREIKLSQSGSFTASSFKLLNDKQEFLLINTHSNKNDEDKLLVSDSDEFGFKINDKEYTGLSEWEFISSQKVENGIKLNLRSKEIELQLSITYLIYPDLPLIRKKLEFKNTGDNKLKLESVDVERLKIADDDVGTSSWIMNDYGRQKHLGQFIGEWYDPIMVIHNHSTKRGVFLGNEAPGVMKRTSAFLKPSLLTTGLTHIQQNFGFRKWIEPNETWESTWVFSGLYNHTNDPSLVLNTTVNDFVRKHMGARIYNVTEKPTFVYNTWEPFRHDINEDIIYGLIDAAAACGAQEFVIDDGWQESYGDWGVSKKKFPNGLKPVFDYIKSKGMKPGVWISLASAETKSNVYIDHPEWTVRKANGEDINLHSDKDKVYDWESRSMCMTTGWKDYIRDVILEMVNEYGLEYVKGDFAAVTGAYTSDKTRSGCHATNHNHKDRNESMLEMYQSTWELFDELHASAPNLFIDCTFETMGALHLIDLDMCKHADGNWLSNFIDNAPLGSLKVRRLAWSRTPVIPASSMVIGNQRLDDPNFVFSLKSLSGTLPIVLGDPRQLSNEQQSEIKTMADWLKKMQVQYDFMSYRQDLPGFGEPQDGFWDGFQRINTDTKSGGIVGVFKQNSKKNEMWVTIDHLDPSSTYEVLLGPEKRVISNGSGKELYSKGFKVIFNKEFQGELYEVRKE